MKNEIPTVIGVCAACLSACFGILKTCSMSKYGYNHKSKKPPSQKREDWYKQK